MKNKIFISIIIVLVIVILILIIRLEKLNHVGEINTSNIEVTNELEEELRMLIPSIEFCNSYLYKQYNGDIFYNSNFTLEDKTSEFNNCEDALTVYARNYKKESTTNEVYLYDYVLLFDSDGTDECKYCKYGQTFNKINIAYNKINKINNHVTLSSFKEYGQIYKYTFKLTKENNYDYISTEAIYE